MARVVAFLLITLVPAIAEAQTAARSFAELNRSRALREGDTILVTCALEQRGQYIEKEARVEAVTDSAITIQLYSPLSESTDLAARSSEHGTRIVIPEPRVRQIVRERKDTIWKGAGIGAAVGGGFMAVLTATYCTREGPCTQEDAGWIAAVLGLSSGIGFGIGALVDATNGGSHSDVVYLAPASTGGTLRISIGPMLSRDRRGLCVSLTW